MEFASRHIAERIGTGRGYLIGALIIFSQSSALSPFIYARF